LYTETTTSLDLFALPDPLGTGERKPIPVANSGLFNETQGQFSPDGRWVAYSSDESGRQEIYVVPFPPGDGRTGK
jgi:Tol biopolymer transport system component